MVAIVSDFACYRMQELPKNILFVFRMKIPDDQMKIRKIDEIPVTATSEEKKPSVSVSINTMIDR